MNISRVKRLENMCLVWQGRNLPKTYCRMSALFNQLFFQAAVTLYLALQK